MSANDAVIVVGGGLTGLCVAHRLALHAIPVVLLEAGARLGGQIHTVREEGCVVELGAEGFVARSVAVPDLCRELGIEAHLVDQLTTLTFAATAEGLVPLGPGEAAELLGFQVPKEELGRGIRSLAGGMGELTSALRDFLAGRVECRLDSAVRSVDGAAGALSVRLASGERLPASAVVIATPSRAAASILDTISGGQSRELARARLLSSLSISLLCDRSAVAHDLAASGLVIPTALQRYGLRACSFVSSKFAGRVGEGSVLLRAFFRPEGDPTATSDAEWTARALEVVGPIIGLSGEPRRAWVSAWADALPIFDEPHHARVRALEAIIEPLSVSLAGSAFHGAGIDAAVVSAERAASQISG